MISIFGHDFQGIFTRLNFSGAVTWYDNHGQGSSNHKQNYQRYVESVDQIKIVVELIFWSCDLPPAEEIQSQYQRIEQLSKTSDLVFVVDRELHDWCVLDQPYYNLKNVYWLYPGTVTEKKQYVIPWQEHIFKMKQLYSNAKLLQELEDLPAYQSKPLLFDALLGRPKPHRVFVHNKILENDLKHRTISSIVNNTTYSPNKPISTNPEFFWEPGCVPVADQPSWHLHHNVDYRGIETSFYDIIPVSVYRQTAYSILAETTWKNQVLMVTEKVGKVCLGRRIFVAFSGQGFLQNLKQSGFLTFDSILDESYDQIANDQDRWQAAWNQLMWLCGQNQSDIFEKARPVLEHNFDHVLEYDWVADTADQIQPRLDLVQANFKLL
jgi:hypothetical protein